MMTRGWEKWYHVQWSATARDNKPNLYFASIIYNTVNTYIKYFKIITLYNNIFYNIYLPLSLENPSKVYH